MLKPHWLKSIITILEEPFWTLSKLDLLLVLQSMKFKVISITLDPILRKNKRMLIHTFLLLKLHVKSSSTTFKPISTTIQVNLKFTKELLMITTTIFKELWTKSLKWASKLKRMPRSKLMGQLKENYSTKISRKSKKNMLKLLLLLMKLMLLLNISKVVLHSSKLREDSIRLFLDFKVNNNVDQILFSNQSLP